MVRFTLLILILASVVLSKLHLVSTLQPSTGSDDFTVVDRLAAIEAADTIIQLAENISTANLEYTRYYLSFLTSMLYFGSKGYPAIDIVAELDLEADNSSQILINSASQIKDVLESKQGEIGVAIDGILQRCELAVSRLLDLTIDAQEALEDLLPTPPGLDIQIKAQLIIVKKIQGYLIEMIDAFANLIQNIN